MASVPSSICGSLMESSPLLGSVGEDSCSDDGSSSEHEECRPIKPKTDYSQAVKKYKELIHEEVCNICNGKHSWRVYNRIWDYSH